MHKRVTGRLVTGNREEEMGSKLIPKAEAVVRQNPLLGSLETQDSLQLHPPPSLPRSPKEEPSAATTRHSSFRLLQEGVTLPGNF